MVGGEVGGVVGAVDVVAGLRRGRLVWVVSGDAMEVVVGGRTLPQACGAWFMFAVGCVVVCCWRMYAVVGCLDGVVGDECGK